MGALARISVVVAASALLAGCGDSGGGGGGRSATRPAELFRTPPAGTTYKVPDPAVVQQVQAAFKKAASQLNADDFAVRQVIKAGKPVAIGVVIDAHQQGDAEDALGGFDEGLKEQSGGVGSQHLTIAGTTAGVGNIQGLAAALAAKNGYVVEALSRQQGTAKTVLARLIFAAGEAKR